ncbi:hypothetical protein KI372_10715 [Halobacterium salinarum]|uniref:hypothetical protein n=1 Tax=Halobacterium salinarum TaxID=2242 RepID=UPI001F4721B7|nr:hypothetical protein [Halobacterium salinarum]MCF2207444.1 hypothetical protein [Halobacterium salinarum]MCF2241809.1 hypothetical protein [Halobacterium salinarum]
MYTGKTEQPCCLCDDPDTVTRIDLPPAAVPEMANSGPIAWQDIEGSVSIHFCDSDWGVVRDLVLDMGQNPLGKCNVARASFVLREDFEALLNDVRDEPDHSGVEAELLADSERVRAAAEEATDSERVQAALVQWVLDEQAEPQRGDD